MGKVQTRSVIIMRLMEPRFVHGELSPMEVAQGLVAEFNRGNLRAQVVGNPEHLAVQIATRPGAGSGGATALTITVQKVEDGLMIRAGTQDWLGTAASLGRTTIAALLNPWNLLGRLDDLAQDVENIQLTERVWQAIDRLTQAAGAGRQLSQRLRRVSCAYCGTANAVGEGTCQACGAPLGNAQPTTCPHCGFVLLRHEARCPNCGQAVAIQA
jgi:hypothetical protein